MTIHRGKKLNGIAKKKDDICKHLEAGNEMNSKIWVSIINNSVFNRLKPYLTRRVNCPSMISYPSCATNSMEDLPVSRSLGKLF